MKRCHRKALLNLTFSGLLAAALVTPAAAHEAGDIILRAGPATVAPDDESGLVGGIAGSGAEVDSNTQLGITLTYMLSNRLGLELLAATPFDHDVDASGSIAALGQVASVKHLPPTLALVYYPLDSASSIQPYLGAGINYTHFFDAEASQSAADALNGGAATGLDVDDSWGLALRTGVDIKLNDKWNFNAGVWYLDIDTEASFETNAGNVSVDIDVDPFVYMFGVSYSF